MPPDWRCSAFFPYLPGDLHQPHMLLQESLRHDFARTLVSVHSVRVRITVSLASVLNGFSPKVHKDFTLVPLRAIFVSVSVWWDFCSWEPPRPPMVELLPVGEARPRFNYIEPTTISIDKSRLQVVSVHGLPSAVLPPFLFLAHLVTARLAKLRSFSVTCDCCGELSRQQYNVQGTYNRQPGFDARSL